MNHSLYGIRSCFACVAALLLGAAASCSPTQAKSGSSGSTGGNGGHGGVGGDAAAGMAAGSSAGGGGDGAGAAGSRGSGGGAQTGSGGNLGTDRDGSPPTLPFEGGMGGSSSVQADSVLKLDGAATITMARDANGTLHMAATVQSPGNGYQLVYGECTTGCADAGNWTTVDLAPADTSNPPSIALTASGQPRILFAWNPVTNTSGYYYSECNSGCMEATNWYAVQLTTSAPTKIVPPARLPFAVSPGGAAAFMVNYDLADQLFYCKTNCGDPNSWTELSIGDANTEPETVAFSGDDDLQLLQRLRRNQDQIVWMECKGDCTSAQNYVQSEVLWEILEPELALTDIAVTSKGAPRILMYSAVPNSTSLDKYFYYLACDSSCDKAASWTITQLPIGTWLAYYGFAFALGSKDQPIVGYVSDTALGYATCTGDCTQGTAWQAFPVVTPLGLDSVYPPPVPAGCAGAIWMMDWGPGLALDASDRPLLSFAAHETAGDRTYDGAVCDYIAGASFLVMP